MSTTSRLPPPTPQFILRGHSSPVHTVSFFRRNTRLISADADGYVVVWATDSKRAVAVWKGHEGAVLGVGVWGERIISHGRDHRVRVWQFRPEDEEQLSKCLPIDVPSNDRSNNRAPNPTSERDPWLLHSLEVNTLNFCSFAMCDDIREAENQFAPCRKMVTDAISDPSTDTTINKFTRPSLAPDSPASPNPILIVLPNALNTGGIDIFQLPSERRLCTIPAEATPTTGMVMAVALTFVNQSLYAVTGYESGHTFVYFCHRPPPPLSSTGSPLPGPWNWQLVYANKAHTQPILSLSLSPHSVLTRARDRRESYYITTSADSLIVKHPFPSPPPPPLLSTTNPTSPQIPLQVLNTKHASQQSVSVRSDGLLFATAGWDGRVRIYSSGARLGPDSPGVARRNTATTSEMRERAVLKWHKDGVFSCAFASLDPDANSEHSREDLSGGIKGDDDDDDGRNKNLLGGREQNREREDHAGVVVKRGNGGPLEQIKERRRDRASRTHLIAAGGKEGKISLWDVF